MQTPRIPCTKSQVPNLLLKFYQRISPTQGTCFHFVTRSVFTVRSYNFAQPSSWRTIPCQLPATAYSLYPHLSSILEAVPPSETCGLTMPWWMGPTYHGVHQRHIFENMVSYCKSICLSSKPLADLRVVSRTEVHVVVFVVVVAVYCQKPAVVKRVYFSTNWCKFS